MMMHGTSDWRLVALFGIWAAFVAGTACGGDRVTGDQDAGGEVSTEWYEARCDGEDDDGDGTVDEGCADKFVVTVPTSQTELSEDRGTEYRILRCSGIAVQSTTWSFLSDGVDDSDQNEGFEPGFLSELSYECAEWRPVYDDPQELPNLPSTAEATTERREEDQQLVRTFSCGPREYVSGVVGVYEGERFTRIGVECTRYEITDRSGGSWKMQAKVRTRSSDCFGTEFKSADSCKDLAVCGEGEFVTSIRPSSADKVIEGETPPLLEGLTVICGKPTEMEITGPDGETRKEPLEVTVEGG